MNNLNGLNYAKRCLTTLNIAWYLHPYLKTTMVVQILRWKYTLIPVPKYLMLYLSKNRQLPNTFTLLHIIVRNSTMHNGIPQPCIVNYWLLWKLSGIGDHLYMVRSLLCTWTTNP